jgi:hypothetical protein
MLGSEEAGRLKQFLSPLLKICCAKFNLAGRAANFEAGKL